MHRRPCRWGSRRVPHERLEQPDVEHVVETGALWKLKAIGDRADTLADLERARVARVELTLWPRVDPVGWPVEKAKPRPIVHCKLQLPMVVVVVSLGVFLCLEKAFMDLHQEVIAVAQEGIRCFCPSHLSGVR